MPRTGQRETSADAASGRPSRTLLVVLALLGLAVAAWSAFLWKELIDARSGGEAFCGFAEEAECDALWDTPFASAVHRTTGLPVAAWGVVWGVVAFVLPLLVVGSRGRGEGGRKRGASGAVPAALSAGRLTAVAGSLGVAVLAVVTAMAELFCFGCAVVYALILAYAFLAFRGRGGVASPAFPHAGRGALTSLGLALASYLLLLWAGLETPRAGAEATREAVAAVEEAEPEIRAPADTGEARAAALEELLTSLDPQVVQAISDALAMYRRAPRVEDGEPRLVLGPDDAAVLVTDFTDPLCPACADLHENLELMRRGLPPGTFRFEPRYFPLDGACNPYLARAPEAPGEIEGSVRCTAVLAMICLEDHPGYAPFSSAIFKNQERLTVEQVFELAEPILPGPELERCIESAETRAALESDLEAARAHGIRGTPLVLVDHRPAVSFGPFLYALLLAEGDPDHPVFEALPPPSPRVTKAP